MVSEIARFLLFLNNLMVDWLLGLMAGFLMSGLVSAVVHRRWVLLLGLLLLSFEVEDHSHSGTGVVAHLSHLLGEVVLVLSWEFLEGLSKGGELSNNDEHILSEVLNELGNIACSLLSSTERHDIEERLFKVALGDILHDLSELREVGHVLLEVSDVGEGTPWV